MVIDEPTLSEVEKDVIWFHKATATTYIVKNVPHVVFDDEEEEYFDSGASVTLTALRDLMVQGRLPVEVDFKDFAHIEFDF